ncbi:energy-coupling factor transporter transmembrane component T family protein [Kribbella catacumbae]|uniref:energy-coupling factor transporter transmembrane component T family protein n=1 Tax=Kribbella catacumbae TaxID=460086 RepID=UPI0003734A6B|nr:energy-coupling factor transporter transmembrane protein EcfT [Kribbella catacumbae]
MTTPQTLPKRTRRRTRPLVLLRPVPGNSPVHRLWAGTKLIVVAVFSVLFAFFPGWGTIALVMVFVLVVARLAVVPRGALPTMPRSLWILLVFGAVTAAPGGGGPTFDVGSTSIGLGGLLGYLQVIMLAVALMGVCALVSWTTNVSEIAPAVSKLGRPFKALRLPVDDWVVTLGLTLRAFPMLSQEFRVLGAARRLRPRPDATTRRERWRRRSTELIDMLATAMTVSLRRADEMGDAITARGGSGQISALPSRPGTADAVAMAVVLGVCALSFVVQLAASG